MINNGYYLQGSIHLDNRKYRIRRSPGEINRLEPDVLQAALADREFIRRAREGHRQPDAGGPDES